MLVKGSITGTHGISIRSVRRTSLSASFRQLSAHNAVVNTALLHSTKRLVSPARQLETLVRTSVVQSSRRYSSNNPFSSSSPEAKEENEEFQEPKELTEMRLAALENTASAPWLLMIPVDHADRLRRSYSLLYQIFLYLGRPMSEEQASQFLLDFHTSSSSSTSDIGRARRAVANICVAVVHVLSSIPETSPLRAPEADRKVKEVFDTFAALRALHDAYLHEENIATLSEEEEISVLQWWPEFWERAQPISLYLAAQLHESGYG